MTMSAIFVGGLGWFSLNEYMRFQMSLLPTCLLFMIYCTPPSWVGVGVTATEPRNDMGPTVALVPTQRTTHGEERCRKGVLRI